MNKKVLVGLLCGIIILIFTPTACTSKGSTTNLPPPQITTGLVEKMTLDDLAATANIIVLGEVVDLTYEKEADGDIRTLAILSVNQTFKGNPLNEVVVNTPGGNLDGVVQIVEGAPTFQTGEKVIVFLGNGDGILSVVGGLQGKFSIDNNEMVGNFSLPQFVEQVRNAVAGQ